MLKTDFKKNRDNDTQFVDLFTGSGILNQGATDMRADTDMVPPKSALGNFFRPGIAADRFAYASSLKKQATPTTMTTDAHSGDNVIADIVGGTVKKSYITPMLDQNVSVTIYDDATLQASGYSLPATFYYNQDERQSVRNLTAADGDITNTYDYTAYGDKLDSLTSGSVEQRYTYTGRELNEVSGDYYFRYRMYSAQLGGFLSRDPLGYVDGLSAYAGWFAKKLVIDPKGRAIDEATKTRLNSELRDRVMALAEEVRSGNRLIVSFRTYSLEVLGDRLREGRTGGQLSKHLRTLAGPVCDPKCPKDRQYTVVSGALYFGSVWWANDGGVTRSGKTSQEHEMVHVSDGLKRWNEFKSNAKKLSPVCLTEEQSEAYINYLYAALLLANEYMTLDGSKFDIQEYHHRDDDEMLQRRARRAAREAAKQRAEMQKWLAVYNSSSGGPE